jgi:hypothetical protein
MCVDYDSDGFCVAIRVGRQALRAARRDEGAKGCLSAERADGWTHGDATKRRHDKSIESQVERSGAAGAALCAPPARE